MIVVGAVQTAEDLGRFEATPGVVLRVIDTDTWVMWGTEAMLDGQATPLAADEDNHWVAVPAGVIGAGRALVDGYWPYVVGSDMVAAWPEVSHDLANKISTLNLNWTQFRDGSAWFGKWDANARYSGGGLILTGAGNPGGVWLQPAADGTSDATLSYYHAGGWWTALRFRYDTLGAPNGMFVQSNAAWNLNNGRNFFAGSFFPSTRATYEARATPDTAQLVPAEDTGEDMPEGAWDLGATVADLVALVNRLAARIDQLEGHR